MFPYDSSLCAAVQTQPRSIDDVLAKMETMETLFADGDGLKWFHQLYLQVTQAVKARVAWLAGLDVQFASLY